MVANRIHAHLFEHDLLDVYRSAYRFAHSTETALIRIHNDIIEALDKGFCVPFVMLDLSAAFDMVDHAILLRRLHSTYGFSDTALDWIKSYLFGRSQRVRVGNDTSSYRTICHGVPQGSVLGPLLYPLYSGPIGNICRKHGVKYHLYADDIQLYLVSRDNVDLSSKIVAIECCIEDLMAWMRSNLLKVNSDKTEFILFRTRFSSSLSPSPIGCLRSLNIPPYIKSLGVYFDSTMSMSKQVNNIAKFCYFHIRNIARIRKYLSFKSCGILVKAFVISRLD